MTMQIRPGYKLTAAGVIPEDWEAMTLGDAIDYTKGFPFRSSDYTAGGVRIIRVSDTTHDSISENSPIFISHEISNIYSRWSLKELDIILSTVGSKPPMYGSMVGKAILVQKKSVGALLNQNAVIIRNKKSEKSIQVLIVNHLRTKRYFDFIEGIFRGNANQASITLKDLFDFFVPLPVNHDERQAIATALSDIDTLINGLDQLIAKKRDIKLAAMQQLLTGQQRLEGFSGEWEVKRTCELGEIVTGSTPSTTVAHYWDGNIPWITPTDISISRDIFESARLITVNGLKSIRRLPANTVLVTCIASIGKNAILRAEGACNQQINAVIPNPKNSVEFLYYIFEASKEHLLSNAGTTATSIISKATFSNLTFRIPPLEEQTAIATILFDMDNELAILETRHNKARQLKQSMMQELLNGRIRLINSGN